MYIIDIDRIWYCTWFQPREILSEHGELMIYRWCLKEINRPLDPQVSLAPLINYNARVNSSLCSAKLPQLDRGLRHYLGEFMRLLSQMHSSFRDVSGSLSAWSSYSFYLLAPPVPLRLFLSSLGFCRTPGLLLYTTRTNTITMFTLALVRVLRLSFPLLPFPSQRGSDSYSFLAFTSSSASSSFFFNIAVLFLHHWRGPFRARAQMAAYRDHPAMLGLRDSL